MFLGGIENAIIHHRIIIFGIDPYLESHLEILGDPMDQAELKLFAIGILDQNRTGGEVPATLLYLS